MKSFILLIKKLSRKPEGIYEKRYLRKWYRMSLLIEYFKNIPRLTLVKNIIAISLFLWVVFSYIEVLLNNMNYNPQYSDANFFVIISYCY